MEDKIITNGVKLKTRFKVKIYWKNGANETVYSFNPPNINPVTPMFMGFKIKDGNERMVALMEIRAMDIEVYNDNSVGIIT